MRDMFPVHFEVISNTYRKQIFLETFLSVEIMEVQPNFK
jgi:hypothetical protein